MARKKKDYEEEYDNYEDDYDDDYEYDYDEDDDYEDDYPRRNPLKGFVVALVILLILMAVIIGLLYTRLQAANNQITELNDSLTATRTELNNLLVEKTTATPEPAVEATPEPVEEATPEPVETTSEPAETPEPPEETTPEPAEEATPEPTAEPTPEPTATPSPLLKDSVTDEDLNGVYRPADQYWKDEPEYGAVDAIYMMALHWGPSLTWNENMALYRDEVVEILAEQDGFVLLRTKDNRFGWGVATLVRAATEEEITAYKAAVNETDEG